MAQDPTNFTIDDGMHVETTNIIPTNSAKNNEKARPGEKEFKMYGLTLFLCEYCGKRCATAFSDSERNKGKPYFYCLCRGKEAKGYFCWFSEAKELLRQREILSNISNRNLDYAMQAMVIRIGTIETELKYLTDLVENIAIKISPSGKGGNTTTYDAMVKHNSDNTKPKLQTNPEWFNPNNPNYRDINQQPNKRFRNGNLVTSGETLNVEN